MEEIQKNFSGLSGLGNKLKGKIVDEIEMKDGYYIYYFDTDGRIRLIEEASSFLKKLDGFRCYDYEDGKIYEYWGNLCTANSIKLSLSDNGKIQETYKIFNPERLGYDKYVYKDDVLNRIDVCVLEAGKEPNEWSENFYFDHNKLKLIQIAGVYKRNLYCDVKINLKKLDSHMEIRMNEMYRMAAEKNPKIIILTVFLNYEERNPNIDFMITPDNETILLQEENKILLREFPLDFQETQDITNNVLKTMVKSWDNKILGEDVYIKIVKDGVNILENDNIIPKWLKKNPQVSFHEEHFQYCFSHYHEEAECKYLKEIYKDLKKSVNRNMCLEELMDIFEKACKVNVKEIIDENFEDTFFMGAEAVLHDEKLVFGFSFIRQIPWEDEFMQLGMEVIYELDDKNRTIAESHWSDKIEEDFFNFVRNTEIYQLKRIEKVRDVRVFLDET